MATSFDQVGTNTGPGRIASELVVGSDVVCKFLLYNFNIDGNVLKREHTEFLDKHAVPLLRKHQLHAKLTGTASRSAVVGDPEYNRRLSASWLLRVKRYLSGQGIPESKLPGSEIIAAGEHLSTSHSHEDVTGDTIGLPSATVSVGYFTCKRPVQQRNR